MNQTVLLVDFFLSQDDDRLSEFLECLSKNCTCNYIDKIVVSVQTQEVDIFWNKIQEFTQEQLSKIQLNTVRPGNRSTYADMFIYCNTFLKGNVCIIANNDIYFDDSLKYIEHMEDKDFLCLSRYNVNQDSSIDDKDITCMSQDVWIFKCEIPMDMVLSSYVYQGTIGCDNYIAFLAVANDMRVYNPSKLIKCYHLHENPERNYKEEDREIGNWTLLTFVHPCSRMKYTDKNLASIFSVGQERSISGQIFVDYCKSIFQRLKQHVHTYNLIKVKNNMKVDLEQLPRKVIAWIKPAGSEKGK